MVDFPPRSTPTHAEPTDQNIIIENWTFGAIWTTKNLNNDLRNNDLRNDYSKRKKQVFISMIRPPPPPGFMPFFFKCVLKIRLKTKRS